MAAGTVLLRPTASAVLQRIPPIFFPEHGGEFALIAVANLFGDAPEREVGFNQKAGGPCHSFAAKIGGHADSVDDVEVIFEG